MEPFTDIRGLLQYVPEFRGKTFVVEIDWADEVDAVKAEVLMDLTALQSVGVKLLLSMSETQANDFFYYSSELEFKVSSALRTTSDVEEVRNVLDRGQSVVVIRESELIAAELIRLSVAVNAKKLVVVSTQDGLNSDDGEVVKFVHVTKPSNEKIASTQLVQSAVNACLLGVPRVHLLDVRKQGVIINEMFSSEGVGTMFYTDSYRNVRPLKEEDISEMLSMIGRSVRNTHLVPRNYEEVKDQIDSYYVLEVDDNVVGCCALYEYEYCAEIACLYVKQSHGGTGYGAQLVNHLETIAKQKGISKTIALSNRAATFFTEELDYTSMPIDELPECRRERLLESGRQSLAFQKNLSS